MNVPAKRPTNIEEVDIDLLCNLLSQGVTIESACAQVGISRKTYNRWRTAGQELEEQQVFQDFYFFGRDSRAFGGHPFIEVRGCSKFQKITIFNTSRHSHFSAFSTCQKFSSRIHGESTFLFSVSVALGTILFKDGHHLMHKINLSRCLCDQE